MEAREKLDEIRKLDVLIKVKQEYLVALEAQMTGLKAITLETKKSSGKATKSPQERYIHKYLDYKEGIIRDIERLNEMKQATITLIDKIKDSECVQVLYQRYILCKKWKNIIEKMEYSESGTFELHRKALVEFEKVCSELE